MATSRQLAVAAAEVCDDKKASDIVALDVRKLTSIADYFVICSASNERQSRAIAEELRETLMKLGVRQLGLEGVNDGHWVLQDFGDIVVHIFHHSRREFYDLDTLWADARRVRWKKASPKA